MKAKVGALVAAGVVLVGCGSSTASSTTVTATATVTVTETPTTSTSAAPSSSTPTATSPAASASTAPAGGQPLGTTQANGTTGKVTVHAIDREVPPAPGVEDGATRTAIDAELCLDGASTKSAQLTTIPWYLTDGSSGRYAAANSTWQSDPQPQYPIGSTVAPGECVRGWLMMNVPATTEVQTVRYESATGSDVLIWSLQ